MAAPLQGRDGVGTNALLGHHVSRLGLPRIEGGRKVSCVPGGGVDRLLKVHSEDGVKKEERQLPLILLVTAWRAECEICGAITQCERWRQGGAWPLTWCQRIR